MVLSSDDEQQIRAVVQQIYFEEDGCFPTAEAVYEKIHRIYPLEKIQEVLEDPENIERFQRVGIKSPLPVGGVLTAQQMLVANKIFNYHDNDSMRMFLESVGVSTTQYASWCRDPTFSAHLKARADAYFKDSESVALRTLTKAAEKGDLNAARMILEMKGKYAKNINMNVNVEVMMVKMVEIVARHIDNPETLEAIARDFEALDA